jgi:uncharacterized protein
MVKPGLTYKLIALEHQPQGLYLSDNDGGKILLPKRYVPDDIQLGEEIRVFVYLDSDDRIVATTQRPRAQLHQAAYLEVVDVNNTGAFLDWGLAKDLMVPYAEQLERMEVGKSYVVYVCEDNTGRLIGTSRLNRFIKDQVGAAKASPWGQSSTPATPELENGDAIKLLVTQRTDLGYKAVVNHRWWGLVHSSDIHTAIRIGQRLEGFVKRVREDGKLDLALDNTGLEQAEPLSRRIMDKLEAAKGRLALSDNSPSELIEMHFGVSKRTFKMAIGKLYKERRIMIEEDGIRLSTPEEKSQAPKRERPAFDADSRPARKPSTDKPRSDSPRAERAYSDKPRGDRPAADRPSGERKPWGDKPRSDRPAGEKRAYSDKPRGDRPAGDRPSGERKPWGDKPRNDSPRGERSYGDKPRGDRPYGDRPSGERKPWGDKPRSDRPAGEKRAYGDKPRGDRPAGDRPSGDRPYGDRPSGERKPWGDKPRNDSPRGERSYGDKPRGDRPAGDRPSGERKPWGDKPRGDSPRGERSYGDKPRSDRPAGDRLSGERKPWGDKPRSDRPAGEKRAYGDKPRGDRPYGDKPRGERTYADKPRGDSPRGDRPSGEKRAYSDKPRGDRPFADKPRGERRVYTDKPRSDRPAAEKRSYGDKPRAARQTERSPNAVWKSNRKPGDNTLSLKKKIDE